MQGRTVPPTIQTPAQRRARMFGWWFVCIGAGFILLLIRGVLLGQRPWVTGVRAVIAAGFLLWGWQTLRGSNPNPRAPGDAGS